MNTEVRGCTFLLNRIDVANQGSLQNLGTFDKDNTYR